MIPRINYLILFILLFLIEIGIALWINDSIIRPYVGDFLVCILIYSFLMGIGVTHWKKGLIISLIICYVTEGLQYIGIVNLLELSSNKIARIIIGTHFSWADMLCYTLAAISIYIVEHIVRISSNDTYHPDLS